MASLLLFVFLVEFAVQIVNNFGTTIDTFLWALYSYMPTEFSRKITEQRKLQKDYLKCRTDLRATSSQDEFAKWAKLRRHHDKILADLEGQKKAIDGAKASFDQKMKIIRWLSTRGLQQVVGFWYRKDPLFWLPAGWFPYYAEWIISFPSAPLGGVSIMMWSWASAGFVTLLSDTIRSVAGLSMASKTATPGATENPSTPKETSEKKTS
ncbi:uncharacterized protein MKZ38_005948 [Zalerion maritima]|uniref:Guided entry of tail-anchored proteins 1 n=1 Tax=Zalerion maritima TaxID=339359 RepID=A0AAD5RXF5_9PEZI|nr:uncharacterized protein MKZ38_005948 [Zalerion maritima]